MTWSRDFTHLVLSTVLSFDPVIKQGTSSYVDDVLVNEDVVSAGHVREHLAKFGLAAKGPERARDGVKLLGLSVQRILNSNYRQWGFLPHIGIFSVFR